MFPLNKATQLTVFLHGYMVMIHTAKSSNSCASWLYTVHCAQTFFANAQTKIKLKIVQEQFFII